MSMVWDRIGQFHVCGQLEKKPYGLLLDFNGFKTTEPLWGDSLLFTTQFPGVPGNNLTDLERVKSWANLGATQWF